MDTKRKNKMKPDYQEKTESVEFRINKRKNKFSKVDEYKNVVSEAYVEKDYFHNQYKAKTFKNAVKFK